jgi:hypothetical protein
MAVQHAPPPGATGWVIITNRRHDNPTRSLPGCPAHEAVFNDPDVTAAEYLAASVAAAGEIYQARLQPVGLFNIRLRHRPQLVEATLPNGAPYINGLHYVPVPLQPTTASQQWGQQWADQGKQGVQTTLPVAPPPGRQNLWTCIYLQPGTTVIAQNSGPWTEP